MLAKRAQKIAVIFQKIASLRYNLNEHYAELTELVDLANALMLPMCWTGIDSSGAIHVTYLMREGRSERPSTRGPTALSFNADFMWEYRPWDNTFYCAKCRDGSVTTGTVVQGTN